MSDATLRALHRSWKVEGTAEAGAAYLKACVQHGALEEGRVAVAALGGLRAARLVLPRRCFDPSETFHEVIAPGLWRRRVPTAADGSADLYALGAVWADSRPARAAEFAGVPPGRNP